MKKNRGALGLVTLLWAVFVLVRTREAWYDIRSFLREEELVGFLQGWGTFSFILLSSGTGSG